MTSRVRPPGFPDHPNLRFSEAGLRGVVGETLTPDLVAAVAAVFAESLPEGPVALGRDSRLSGPMLVAAVTAGLRGVGREVLDLGLAPTPTVEIYVRHTGAAGGIVVTASHNPPQWNALKLIGPGGFFIDREEARALRLAYDGGISWNPYDRLGSVREVTDAIEIHIARVLAAVDASVIRSRRFRVVVDAVNGAASAATPRLLEELGCEAILIHNDPSKPFPHDPEPRPEHLGDLIRAVHDTGAACGFAQDPDADRLALVAEGGAALSEELTLVLAVRHVLSREKWKKPPKGEAPAAARPVVGNLSGSRALERVAAEFGTKVLRTPIGEIHVTKKMREVGAAIGGEGNGGVMYAPVHECRDSLTGIALILEAMALTGKPLGQLAGEIPSLVMKKAKIQLGDPARTGEILARVEEAFADRPGLVVNREDGVLLEWGPDATHRDWVHVRASNTEPILRIMAESETENETDEILALAGAGTRIPPAARR